MGRYARPLALFLAGVGISLGLEVSLWAQTNPPSASNSCVKCHAEVGDELATPIAQVEGDAHGRRGLSCASCHGGDPNDEDHDRSIRERVSSEHPVPARSSLFAENVTAMPNS